MVIDYLSIVAIVLVIIIIYLFFRMRRMMRGLSGADNKMNTMELIKNWQEQKSKDNAYQNELKLRAKEEARPEVERRMVERYKTEEINKLTADPKDRFKQNLKSGLGLDADKMFSDERMDRMVGKSTMGGGLNGQVGSSDGMFSKERIDRMSNTGINPERISKSSGTLNWGDGVRQGLRNENKFSGIERAIGRDKEGIKRTPPKRP